MFDDSQEVWSVFLGMSKAFDKAWHKNYIFKLKLNGVSSNLLGTLTKSGVEWSTVFMVKY